MARKTKQLKQNIYPWFALLDLEIATEKAAPPARVKGRPRAPFQKTKVTMTMTPDQLQMLDRLIAAFQTKMGKSIPRGTLVSFLVYQMMSQLGDEEGNIDLPDHVTNFTTLADYVESQRG
jgi:hypothetical protein